MSAPRQHIVQRRQLRPKRFRQILCIASDAPRNCRRRQRFIFRMQPAHHAIERIDRPLRLCMNFNRASREHPLGKRLPRLPRALVRVGEDRDVPGIVATRSGKQTLPRELHAIPRAEELHQLVSVRRQVTRLYIPLRPSRGRVFMQQIGVPNRRPNPVPAQRDNKLEVRLPFCGDATRILGRNSCSKG